MDATTDHDRVHVPRIALREGGLVVSRIAAGCWRLLQQTGGNPDLAERFIKDCLALGITTFDHADIYGRYGVESLFGDVLARQPGLREKIEIIDKCGIAPAVPERPEHRIPHYDSSRTHIMRSVERSLRALRTDRLDLLLLHRPDPLMDVDETAGVFQELVEAGKVLHVGVSNFSTSQVALLQRRLGIPLATHQMEMSVLATEAFGDGRTDQCQALVMSPMAWSPLGGGRLLTGDEEHVASLRSVLDSMAALHPGANATTMALAWLLCHPSRIVPVLGTTRPDRLRQAAMAFAVSLSRQDWFAIYAAAGHPIK